MVDKVRVGSVTIASTLAFDPAHPHALALYCSDGRFTDSVEELVHGLGHPRLDTITLPGGPALLNLLNTGFADLETVTRATSFLIRSHAITHVFLLAHEGCGYYRARMRGGTPASIAEAQRSDLAIAGEVIKGLHHDVRVQGWYARPVKGRVLFDPM
ncbi:MAG: carbonic anhydrase [Polyangiales bacterium]